jgi:hypothetical protein
MKNTVGLFYFCRMTLFAVVCAFGWIDSAFAGVTSGQIGSVEVVGSAGGAPNNFDFRVTFAGSLVICNGQTWAYMNTTDANYQATMANILSARALGSVVYISWLQQGSYCQIVFISW